MRIEIKSTGPYSANVIVDGAEFGTAERLDYSWLVMENAGPRQAPPTGAGLEAWIDEPMHPLEGNYPGTKIESLGYAITQCVDGVTAVLVNGVEVQQ